MELIRVCCVCNRTEHNGEWGKHPHHQKDDETLRTHGFCDPCYKKQMDNINLELHEEGIKPDHRYDI